VPAPKKTISRKIAPTKLSRRGIGISRLPEGLPPPPLPDFVEPMKAQLVDSTQSGDWIYEIMDFRFMLNLQICQDNNGIAL
jgi:hypothetical protein